MWIYAWMGSSLSSFRESTAFHCVTTHIYCLRRDSLLKGATYKHSTRVGESILNSEVITCRGSWVGEIGDQKSKGWDDSRIEQHAWSRGMGLRGAIDE